MDRREMLLTTLTPALVRLEKVSSNEQEVKQLFIDIRDMGQGISPLYVIDRCKSPKGAIVHFDEICTSGPLSQSQANVLKKAIDKMWEDWRHKRKGYTREAFGFPSQCKVRERVSEQSIIIDVNFCYSFIRIPR